MTQHQPGRIRNALKFTALFVLFVGILFAAGTYGERAQHQRVAEQSK